MGWDAGPAPHPVGPHADLAGRWSAALREGARDHIVPMSAAEAHALLTELAGELGAAAGRSPIPADRVAAAGARLAQAHFVGSEVLGRSIAVLAEYFGSGHADLLAAFATGYLRAFRGWLLHEQESVRTAEITARRTAEEQLRASEARLRAVFSQAGIGTGLSNMSGRIIEVNMAFARMLGYRPEEMCAMSVTDLTHPDDAPGMWELYSALLRGEIDNVQVEKAYAHRDGHAVWTNLNVSLIRDSSGKPHYTLVLVEDISERRALRERLDYRANHDQLTGLPNRSCFFDALRGAFADPSAGVGLCYVDLDHFKSVNDTFGHAAGDELLVQTAARLTACAALPGQLVARMGGDEFVILVPRPRVAGEVSALARTVLDALARPFDVQGRHLTVTASIGVVEDRGEHATADDLLKSADTTMYWAKAAGRDRYSVFDPDRGRREHTRAELSAAMPASFTRGEFFLDYQPIVALPDRSLVAVEALVRWRHPELGVLPPGRFVDLAEDNGHIDALGALVLQLACHDSRRWYDRFPEHTPTVSVNVSAAEVSDPTWLERVQRIIAETGIPPDRLQLELTERTFMETTGRPLEALRTLAEGGVRIAIDDFGTGYSNLAYLGQLPLHVVKLAGPFVQRIRTPETVNRTDLLVLETIIGLTHALGLTVTAECVETGYQAERLHALGCDSAQGWHFHRPMPAQRITDLLAEPAVENIR
ncbi:putative bifunctional diguanylate cyclase/phosphodiesterase [Nocardia bovistercoris]|uniref:EAL domain-containing protein n=1 Tax=Nocardia bovistercoris TaxID=2785916 RepID=A0A931IAK8_9NOCA|nr:bifunctional diguanylate cyclase/phosphodiesterase [Nocardia bovistercoris]MBH0776925.1 EAL domain-containing protein [Nocardia bovistercoris]